MVKLNMLGKKPDARAGCKSYSECPYIKPTYLTTLIPRFQTPVPFPPLLEESLQYSINQPVEKVPAQVRAPRLVEEEEVVVALLFSINISSVQNPYNFEQTHHHQ